MMRSYPGGFYHIISKMINNSFKHAFTDNKGEIKLSIKSQQKHIELIYEDDGKGMEPEVVSKIFDPFYTTKRGEGGTGLGLYMTYNIVTQRLEGDIKVQSAVGEGTRFVLNLPLDISDSNEHHKNFSV